MKRVAAAFVLLTLLIIGCAAGYTFIRATSLSLTAQIDQVSADLDEQDPDSAAAHLSESYRQWQAQHKLLGLLLHHNMLDEIETLYLRAQQHAENGSILQCQVTVRELSSKLQKLIDSEQLNFKNIL